MGRGSKKMSKKRGEKSLARISTVHFQPFCRRLSSKGIFYLPIDMKDCTCQTIEENFFGKKILQPWLKEVLYNYFFSRDPILIYTIYVHWLVDTIVVFNSLFDTGTIILWFYSFQLYSIPLGTNPSTSKVFSDRKLECM